MRKSTAYRIFRMIIIIILGMIIVSLFIGIINVISNKSTTDTQTSDSIIDVLVSILGYGDVGTQPKIAKLIISFTGIIGLTFFSAYLTVNLFVRKKLYVDQRLVLWEKLDKRFASVALINNGDSINSLEAMLILYDGDECLGSLSPSESFPTIFIPSKAFWKAEFEISPYNGLWKALAKIGHETIKVYLCLKYTDVYSGQQFTNIYRFNSENIVGSETAGGFKYLSNPSLLKEKQSQSKERQHMRLKRLSFKRNIIKNIFCSESNTILQRILDEIKDNRHKISSNIAEAIGGATTIQVNKLPDSQREEVLATVNWQNTRPDDMFTMICFKYHEAQDWSGYLEKKAKIEFQLLADENVNAVCFELKACDKHTTEPKFKLMDEKIPIEQYNVTSHSFDLGQDASKIDLYDGIIEICFLVWSDDIIDKEKIFNYSIIDLCITETKASSVDNSDTQNNEDDA